MLVTLIQSAIKTLIKGQFGIFLVVKSSCDKKLKKSGSHYLGRIEKVTMLSNAKVGASYKGMVQAKADEKFTPQPLKGMHWVLYPFIKESDKSGKQYLCVNYRKCDARTAFKSYYLLDGKLATKEQIDEFKAYFYAEKKEQPQTQVAVGVSEEEMTSVVNYCIDDIEYFGNSKNDALKIFAELSK